MTADPPTSSSRHYIARLVNFFYRLRGTSDVTSTSPTHNPFHLYEFALDTFGRKGRRLGYEIAHKEVRVCAIYHVQRIPYRLLRCIMARTATGMRLTVYLRRVC